MSKYRKEMTTTVSIDGKWIPLGTKTICSANILKVEAGTNGIHGGDSGHGCRTYFSICDAGGTDLRVNALPDGIEIALGGDAELQTFIEALTFAADTLKEMLDQSRGRKIVT